ncbi:hypothetical protein Mpsy_0038 [Methanolobus psychrophilus R15]|nr:hypothetical protein Mpsy_0038 [Methanolobus psychrophilus R15]
MHIFFYIYCTYSSKMNAGMPKQTCGTKALSRKRKISC